MLFRSGRWQKKYAKDIQAFAQNGYRCILSVECVNGEDFAKPGEADKKSMDVYRTIE